MAKTSAILVVDDQPSLLENIGLTLETAGYGVLTAMDGVEAVAVLEAQPVSLILADIAMPEMNGYQLFERVQQNPRWASIPFVFLTARAMDSDIRYGKQLGVDDYLTKPITPADLLAVVEGKLRRAQRLERSVSRSEMTSSRDSAVVVGQLWIDPKQHRVRLAGEEIGLSAKEFALLQHLAAQAGQVVSHQDLIRITHKLDTDPVEAGTLLRPLIARLRHKLGYGTAEESCIENVRGVGYRLAVASE